MNTQSFITQLIKKILNFKYLDLSLIFLCFLIAIFIRTYQFEKIPAEMWGDVIEHYILAGEIKKGNFYNSFLFGGDGPLMSYFHALVSLFMPLSFNSLKLTSIIIDSFTAIFIYAIIKRLFGRRYLAITASLLYATSFWALVHSRQGKPCILAPFFLAATLLLYLKKKHLANAYLLAASLYTQIASYGIILVFLFVPLSFFPSLILASPLFIKHSPISPNSGYLMEKFALDKFTYLEKIKLYVFNLWRNIRALFIYGDPGFRSNVPNDAHVNYLFQVLLIVYLLIFLYKLIKKRLKKIDLLIFYAFFVVQIPAILDINNLGSTPNIGRTIAVLPIVIIMISQSIFSLFKKIKNFYLTIILASSLILASATLDLGKFFYLYPHSLPAANTPFGKIIAEYINLHHPHAKIIQINCCYQDGQPEPNAIKFYLNDQNYYQVFTSQNFTTSSIESVKTQAKEFLLIYNPKETLQTEILNNFQIIKKEKIVQDNWEIADLYLLKAF